MRDISIISQKINDMECTKCKAEIQFLEIHLKWHKTKDGHIKHKCKSCGKMNGITQAINGTLVTY